MTFTINFFYRPSKHFYINATTERELKHQLHHCRGYLHEISLPEENKHGFVLYKVTCPSYTTYALIRDVPQTFHVWDIKLYQDEPFYTSKHHTNAKNFLAPKDEDLKKLYWFCNKTDLREHKTY